MKGKGILLQLRNVLQAFQFSRSHTHRYKTSLSKGRTFSLYPNCENKNQCFGIWKKSENSLEGIWAGYRTCLLSPSASLLSIAPHSWTLILLHEFINVIQNNDSRTFYKPVLVMIVEKAE